MNRFIQLYRNAYTGLSRETWLLSLIMLVNRAGTMVLPFMSLYLTRSLGFSVGNATLVVSIFGVGAIFGGFVGGKLTGRLGAYPIQVGALAAGGVMFFLLGQMTSFRAICAFTFLLSLMNECFRPANAAAIALYSKPENRTRSYSLNRLAINLGWALGGSLGGFIAAYDYHLLFIIDGISNLLAAVAILLLLPRRLSAPTAEKATQVSGRSPYRDIRFLCFSICTFLFAAAFFQLFSTQPVFFNKALGLSERHIGVIMALNGVLIALIEMVAVHNLEGRRPPLQYITFGTVVIGCSFGLLNLPGGAAVAWLSMLLVTAGEIFSMPFMNAYWIGRSTDATRGQYAGLYTMTWAAAQVAGPYSGGKIAECFGYTTLWYIILGISTIAAAGYFLLLRNGRYSPAADVAKDLAVAEEQAPNADGGAALAQRN